MQINPQEYKENIDWWCRFHSVTTLLNTAALITLSWFSFSSYSPLAQQNPDPKKFDTIAYPAYIGLLIIPSLILYKTLMSFWTIFAEDENTFITEDAIAEYQTTIQNILDEHSRTFNIPATPNICIVKTPIENAFVFQFAQYTPQYLLMNSGCMQSASRDSVSLKILLAHELMHFEYDLPLLSSKRLQSLLNIFNILFLSFGYTPMQIGFSIAGAATVGFQPAFVYLPLLGLLLTIISVLSLFQECRARERNADYCALFGGKKFDDDEYQKHMVHYALRLKEKSLFEQWVSTHPHGTERMALLYAAQESVTPLPSTVDVGVMA